MVEDEGVDEDKGGYEDEDGHGGQLPPATQRGNL
jgi:hypothetical protein